MPFFSLFNNNFNRYFTHKMRKSKFEEFLENFQDHQFEEDPLELDFKDDLLAFNEFDGGLIPWKDDS